MKVVIDRLDHYGRGICNVDGKICFVKNALPKEEVEIEIIKEKKKYLEGKVVRYLKSSKSRIKENCPYSSICGGCNLNHISFEEENAFKTKKVKDLVEKFSKVDSSLVRDISFLEDAFYRNKVVFHVRDKRLGFYEENSNRLVEVDQCYLVVDEINALIPTLKELVVVNAISEITVRVGNISKEVMVSLKGKVTNYSPIIDKVDVLVINDKIITKKESITSQIGEYKFLVSYDAFFQVNKNLTEKLYDEILKNIKKNHSSNVLDLYCGTGTIGIYISKYVKYVVGIEINKMAVEDAKSNKILNSINNIDFMAGKVEELVSSIKDKFDTVIVDPPRSGLDKVTLENVIKISPDLLIYTSCDPVTLARDLNILKEFYTIKYIQPFNMFPRTYHVETVCVLERIE